MNESINCKSINCKSIIDIIKKCGIVIDDNVEIKKFDNSNYSIELYDHIRKQKYTCELVKKNDFISLIIKIVIEYPTGVIEESYYDIISKALISKTCLYEMYGYQCEVKDAIKNLEINLYKCDIDKAIYRQSYKATLPYNKECQCMNSGSINIEKYTYTGRDNIEGIRIYQDDKVSYRGCFVLNCESFFLDDDFKKRCTLEEINAILKVDSYISFKGMDTEFKIQKYHDTIQFECNNGTKIIWVGYKGNKGRLTVLELEILISKLQECENDIINTFCDELEALIRVRKRKEELIPVYSINSFKVNKPDKIFNDMIGYPRWYMENLISLYEQKLAKNGYQKKLV